MTPRVLIVDAYDSFVHILVDYVRRLGCEVDVVRHDDPALHEFIDAAKTDVIILGPGPGHPADSGYLAILRQADGLIPTLGVCLGHQAIGMFYGAKLQYAERLMHGKQSSIIHDGTGCFRGLPDRFLAMRYHSIIVSDDELPDGLSVSARSDVDSYVMAIAHDRHPIAGVQFHPESIGSSHGMRIISNFMEQHCKGGVTDDGF